MIILNINVMVLEIKIYHLKNILIKLIHTWIYINMILVPSKNWVFLGGGTKYFARKGNKLEKEWRWGGWCRNGRVATFLFFFSSITFTVCVFVCVWVCVWGGGGGGGLPLFLLFLTFSTVQFIHIYCVLCGESKVPFITFWIFSLLS